MLPSHPKGSHHFVATILFPFLNLTLLHSVQGNCWASRSILWIKHNPQLFFKWYKLLPILRKRTHFQLATELVSIPHCSEQKKACMYMEMHYLSLITFSVTETILLPQLLKKNHAFCLSQENLNHQATKLFETWITASVPLLVSCYRA